MRKEMRYLLLAILGSALLGGCATTSNDPGEVGGVADVQTGLASYYADYYHGRNTASGEVFDNDGLTAAHRTLPFSTVVRVTNLANGKSVLLRINDRGPFVAGRILDVSRRAATDLGFIRQGTTKVRLEILPGG